MKSLSCTIATGLGATNGSHCFSPPTHDVFLLPPATISAGPCGSSAGPCGSSCGKTQTPIPSRVIETILVNLPSMLEKGVTRGPSNRSPECQ